jgi:hypothetical protein
MQNNVLQYMHDISAEANPQNMQKDMQKNLQNNMNENMQNMQNIEMNMQK